jgi:hypothetical protein
MLLVSSSIANQLFSFIFVSCLQKAFLFRVLMSKICLRTRLGVAAATKQHLFRTAKKGKFLSDHSPALTKKVASCPRLSHDTMCDRKQSTRRTPPAREATALVQPDKEA